MITRQELKNFPSKTGVYVFKQNNLPVYIGKSVNIKARLTSHFENAAYGGKEESIIKFSDKIEYIITESEFKALLLESKLIQKYRPKYNSRWKDDKSYLYIEITTSDEFPKIFLSRKTEIEKKSKNIYFGPFSSVKTAESLLKSIRRVFPYCSQKKITERSCFYSKIGLCKPCPNQINGLTDYELRIKLKREYKKNIKQIVKTLEGKTELVLKDLSASLNKLSKEKKYEEALILRNKVNDFNNLVNDRSFSHHEDQFNRTEKMIDDLKDLLSKYIDISDIHRIEAYDMSDLSQKEATGSMVVFIDGQSDKSQYRKFKIKDLKSISDTRRFEEVLVRRFKNNWEKPDLIIVDGGRPQILTVKKVLFDLKINIPLISIAKNPDRLIILTKKKLITLRLPNNSLGFILIRLIRDESHRFARKYHLFLRDKKMI